MYHISQHQYSESQVKHCPHRKLTVYINYNLASVKLTNGQLESEESISLHNLITFHDVRSIF